MEKVELSIHEALQLNASDAHVDLLVRELALTRLQSLFESIWGIIFNSQIKALQAIKAAGSLEKSALEPFFKEVQSDLPEHWTFDEWAEYLLVTSDLVTSDGKNLVTSELGDDFLSWLPTKGGLRRAF